MTNKSKCRSRLQQRLKLEKSHLRPNVIESVASRHTRNMATPFLSPKNYILEPTIAEELKSNVVAILIIPNDAQVAILSKSTISALQTKGIDVRND